MNAPLVTLNRPEPARFTVEEFIRLHETGVFDRYSKSELIEGEIVCINSQWSPHARAKSRLTIELATALRTMGSVFEPLVEVSVRLSNDSLPEPDITLTNYRGGGAVPAETVALIVEVSDTTLDIDLGRKALLYAAAGIQEYWVIDLNENCVWLHDQSGAEGYLARADILLGETLHSVTIEGLSVETKNLLD